MIRIYLISSNELACEALGAALARSEDLSLEGRASHFPVRHCSKIEALADLEVDIVLIDATQAATPALEFFRELAEEHPGAKLLPLGLEGPRQAVDFLEAGAAGYAVKQDSLARVIETIHAVAAGRPPCSPRIAAMGFARTRELGRGRSAPPSPPGRTLSAREAQILRLLALGLANKEIAKRLGIALSTAGNHVQRILEKLAVHRRRDALRRAYEQGLLEGALSPI